MRSGSREWRRCSYPFAASFGSELPRHRTNSQLRPVRGIDSGSLGGTKTHIHAGQADEAIREGFSFSFDKWRR